MKEKCRTCRYRERKTGLFDHRIYRHCSSKKMFGGSREVRKYYPLDGLLTWGAGNINSGFLTGPGFGCIHWVAIEKKGNKNE